MDCLEKHEAFHGILVHDHGRFDPHLTTHAIHIAQRKLEIVESPINTAPARHSSLRPNMRTEGEEATGQRHHDPEVR